VPAVCPQAQVLAASAKFVSKFITSAPGQQSRLHATAFAPLIFKQIFDCTPAPRIAAC
jgi:hypothetical protein